MARASRSGVSAAAWFCAQPGFHVPLSSRERVEHPPEPHDPANCINEALGVPCGLAEEKPTGEDK